MSGRSILLYDDLGSKKNIRYTAVHINRLVKVGKFPKPFKLGGGRNCWFEDEVDAYLEARAAERHQPAA